MVAAATNNLCEAANAAVQGHASEEKLISSAKQVAASTAQLLVACKVKADHDSEAMKRLQVSPRLPLQPQLFKARVGGESRAHGCSPGLALPACLPSVGSSLDHRLQVTQALLLEVCQCE